MKIASQASVLNAALSLAAVGARATGKTVPIVRLVAADGAVTVTCGDSNIVIVATATGDVSEPGQAAVDARKMAALIAGFPAGATVAIATTGTDLTVASGSSRSRLARIPTDSLPSPLALDYVIGSVEVAGADCLTLLSPAFAARSEQTRQYLCGVFWHDTGGKITAVATDGVCLCQVSVPAATFATDRSLILPISAVATMQKLISKTKPGTVTLRRSRRLFSVTTPAFSFVSRMIDAGDNGYVFYERVIPPAAAATVAVNRNNLISALSRIAAVSSIDPTLAALSWTHGAPLDVYLAREPKTGADTIAATAKGRGDVAVPLGQLVGMLAEFSGETVDLETDDGRPLVFQGDGKLGLVTRSAWNFQNRVEAG